MYELHGVTKTSQLDFSAVFESFRELVGRGRLLDPRAYYHLLLEGKLRPKVVETISDARVELDAHLRSSIVGFTELWSQPIIARWREEGRTDGGEMDDDSFWKLRWLLNWTLVGEDRLKAALVLAVAELCRKGTQQDQGNMRQSVFIKRDEAL